MMPTKVHLNVVSTQRAPNDFWVFDTLLAKVGDTVNWESPGREMILFIPSKGLFEGPGILPDQRVFEINALHGYRLDLKLKADLGQAGETIMIPYAAFCFPAGEVSEVEMRAKMIIKR